MHYIIFLHYYSYLWNLKKLQTRQVYLWSWEKKGDVGARRPKLNNGPHSWGGFNIFFHLEKEDRNYIKALKQYKTYVPYL